jgi:hypothetical protein
MCYNLYSIHPGLCTEQRHMGIVLEYKCIVKWDQALPLFHICVHVIYISSFTDIMKRIILQRDHIIMGTVVC